MTGSRTSGERLKVGIIGGGAITQVAHLPVLKKLKMIEVPAICDTDLPEGPRPRRSLRRQGRLRRHRGSAPLRGAGRGGDLLPQRTCTSRTFSPRSRPGVHVLVEKPLAMSAASAQRIVRAVEKRQRVVMVGMNHRYRPDVQIVRSFVQGGELGTIESVRGSWHVFRPSRNQLGWRQRRDQAGGGAMLDLGLSILDLGLWLGGNPAPVRVSASLDAGKDRSVEQSGSAFVVCENGMSLFVDVTWRHLGEGERFGVGVRGNKGSAAINPLTVWKELHGVPMDVSPTGVGEP